MRRGCQTDYINVNGFWEWHTMSKLGNDHVNQGGLTGHCQSMDIQPQGMMFMRQ